MMMRISLLSILESERLGMSVKVYSLGTKLVLFVVVEVTKICFCKTLQYFEGRRI